MDTKTIQLTASIYKTNGKEFTWNEVEELMDDFVDFLENKGLMFGGGYESVFGARHSECFQFSLWSFFFFY